MTKKKGGRRRGNGSRPCETPNLNSTNSLLEALWSREAAAIERLAEELGLPPAGRDFLLRIDLLEQALDETEGELFEAVVATREERDELDESCSWGGEPIHEVLTARLRALPPERELALEALESELALAVAEGEITKDHGETIWRAAADSKAPSGHRGGAK